jgi:hypothetical protein
VPIVDTPAAIDDLVADNAPAASNVTRSAAKIAALIAAVNANSAYWATPEQYGAVADGVTDCTAAVNAAHAALFAAGGGILLWGKGTYVVNGRITLPNDGTLVGIVGAAGVPITWHGVGNDTDCAAGALKTPKGTNVKLAFQDAAGWAGTGGRLQALGRATFKVRDLNFTSPDTPVGVASTPFIFASQASLDIDSSVSFWGPSNRKTTNADCDAIVLGGTVATIDNSNGSAFQGYATNLDGFYCSAIRRSVYCRTYVNGIKIRGPVMWITCGTNLANGAAIELDGSADNCAGNYIEAPLTELVSGYTYAIKLTKAVFNTIVAPNAYDAGAVVAAVVRCDVGAYNNIILAGMQLSAKAGVERPTLSEDATVAGKNVIISNRFTERTRFLSMSAGAAGYPNIFDETQFTGQAATIFQPGGATGTNTAAVGYQILRPGAAASSPGVSAYKMDVNGAATFSDPNSATSGNVTVSASGQVESWQQGKSWGFNGRAGGNMTWDTGTGGSVAAIKAVNIQFKTHTGALMVKVQAAAGGVGEGFEFGSASDVSLYRLSATALKTPQKLITGAGLGVGNSAAATTLGAVVKKMEVFDATGASLGFIPIYDAIT